MTLPPAKGFADALVAAWGALGQVLQEARPGWRADASPGVQHALENVGVGS